MVACTRRSEAVRYAETGGDKPRPYAAPCRLNASDSPP